MAGRSKQSLCEVHVELGNGLGKEVKVRKGSLKVKYHVTLFILKPNRQERRVYTSFENLLNRWRHDQFCEPLSKMVSFITLARYFHSKTTVLDQWISEKLKNVLFKNI